MNMIPQEEDKKIRSFYISFSQILPNKFSEKNFTVNQTMIEVFIFTFCTNSDQSSSDDELIYHSTLPCTVN